MSLHPDILTFAKSCGYVTAGIFGAFENKHSDIKCITLYKEDIRTPQTELEIQFGRVISFLAEIER